MVGSDSVFEFPTRDVSWNKRDSILFALSIGADIDELNLVFENNPGFQAFPTYTSILPLKGTSQDVIDFRSTMSSIQIPDVPILKPERIVDAHRAITFHRQLPATSAGKQFEIQQKVTGVYDKGRAGTVLELNTILREKDSGQVYSEMKGNTFFVGQGNWGGPKGPSPPEYAAPNDREPDAVEVSLTNTQSPLFYRLNGDYNELHVIDGPGKRMGFGGPVMHGLFTYNVAAHAVLKRLGRSKAQNMKYFSAKFQAPVKPKDTLVTEIWRTGIVEEGFEDIRFLTKLESGKIVLSNGKALIRVDSLNKL